MRSNQRFDANNKALGRTVQERLAAAKTFSRREAFRGRSSVMDRRHTPR